MQRISIAIAVSFQPDVLLLDEPSSALDDQSVQLVESTLRQLNCLWITHSPEQAKRIGTGGHLIVRGGDQNQPALNGVAVDSPRDTDSTRNDSQSSRRMNGHRSENGRISNQ
ncbi:hypothetical protein BGW42_005030 [Actinomortierella wolfii]|nr:hypothetical protein BGW42_005030 [Actinomortierella wolfii]